MTNTTINVTADNNGNKYFSIVLDKDIKAGTELTFSINGSDPVEQMIYDNGYIKNSATHRRWIMAQTFRLMGQYGGEWTYNVNKIPYVYQLTMVRDEMKVLTKLNSDKDTYDERHMFFTQRKCYEILMQIEDDIIRTVERTFSERTDEWKYNESRYDMILFNLDKIRYNAKYIGVMFYQNIIDNYDALIKFINSTPVVGAVINKYCKKNQLWMDTFKGAGAYYSLKNMIMYHDVTNSKILFSANETRESALRKLRDETYKDMQENKGYYLLGKLKAVVDEIDFDFYRAIR